MLLQQCLTASVTAESGLTCAYPPHLADGHGGLVVTVPIPISKVFGLELGISL